MASEAHDFRQSFDELVHMFDYDQKSPLIVKETGTEHRDGVVIRDISYESLAIEWMNAYLVAPTAEEPLAGIVFLHPAPGNRSTFLEEAIGLATSKAASLLIDAPWASVEFAQQLYGKTVEEIRDTYIKIAIDIRRGIDMLAQHVPVDRASIGVVGHSVGAVFAGLLTGIDKRIKACVLMAGFSSFADLAAINDPSLRGAQLEHYRGVMSPIDANRYISRAAPTALFYQFAKNDELFPREVFDAFYNAGSEPKSAKWYDAGHYLNDEARKDRDQWLSAQLNLT